MASLGRNSLCASKYADTFAKQKTKYFTPNNYLYITAYAIIYTNYMSIKSIIPSQVLDSRGEPTLKVIMIADDDSTAWFVVPSGVSIGSKEAQKKLDGDKSYGGKSVNSCVETINQTVAPKFIGYPIGHQEDFDSLLIALDGSDNKQNLGANTILALSGAYYKLSAAISKKPLWQYIAENHSSNPKFPRIYANLVGGGKHAPGLDIQEFMIVPKSDNPIMAIEQISLMYSTIQKIMTGLYGPGAKLVGDEGAIAPIGARTEVVLETLAGLNAKSEAKFDIALDVAANSFYNGKTYKFEGQSLHASDLMAIYQQWDSKFDIFSIEDPFAEDDLEGLGLLKTTPKENKKFMVVADDYTATNAQQIAQYAQDKLFDAIIIKPDQIGSITEMIQAIDAAKEAGNEIIISHRSGESNDDFIVDLAYGLGAYGIKIGAPNRGERIAKYNRLLEIQYSLDSVQNRAMKADSSINTPKKTTTDTQASVTAPIGSSNNATLPTTASPSAIAGLPGATTYNTTEQHLGSPPARPRLNAKTTPRDTIPAATRPSSPGISRPSLSPSITANRQPQDQYNSGEGIYNVVDSATQTQEAGSVAPILDSL